MTQNKSVEEVMKDFTCINSQCDGYGNIPHQVSEDEWEAEQCQFCFEYRFPLKVLLQQERQISQKKEREIVEEVIRLSDEAERRNETEFNEWRAFKGFRNELHDWAKEKGIITPNKD